jgi:GT2 family glycosyltransferase
VPAATVIVPTHDHGPLLRWSVESALHQDFTDLAVVIICDGSPPYVRDIVDDLVERDPRVSYR